MKLLFDFLPIILFFITYKFFGIFAATGVAIAASAFQLSWDWYKNHRFEFTYVITFILIAILGGATLFLHNDIFIKWKPTAIYWVLAAVFFGSRLIGKKTVIQRLLGSKLVLPESIWKRLNTSWIIFFFTVGLVNLFVIYHFSTNTWVYFKLFGVLGITLLFGFLQSLYIAKYVNIHGQEKDKLSKSKGQT